MILTCWEAVENRQRIQCYHPPVNVPHPLSESVKFGLYASETLLECLQRQTQAKRQTRFIKTDYSLLSSCLPQPDFPMFALREATSPSGNASSLIRQQEQSHERNNDSSKPSGSYFEINTAQTIKPKRGNRAQSRKARSTRARW